MVVFGDDASKMQHNANILNSASRILQCWSYYVKINSAEKNSDEKYPRTLILSPDPELSTPTESRHTMCLLEGKSPSVKLMSRRENKELAKTNLKNMGRTMQKLQHIGSIKDVRPKNSHNAWCTRKIAWENSRQWFPHEVTSKKRRQKFLRDRQRSTLFIHASLDHQKLVSIRGGQFHTDDASLLRFG